MSYQHRAVALGLLLCALCCPFASSAGEKPETPPTEEELSTQRRQALGEAEQAYRKNPSPPNERAFMKAARACLWDTAKEANRQAVAALGKCGSYNSREELVGFLHKFDRLDEKRRDKHTAAQQLVKLALLRIDTAGTFDYEDEHNIRYHKREPEGKAVFLRAAYWAHRDDGPLVEWVVVSLAPLEHELALEALEAIRKDVARKLKAKPGSWWWKTRLGPLVETSIKLNGLVAKAKTAVAGIEAALMTEDLKLIKLALAFGATLEPERRTDLPAVLSKALAYHAEALEKAKGNYDKQVLEQDILKELKRSQKRLSEETKDAKLRPRATSSESAKATEGGLKKQD